MTEDRSITVLAVDDDPTLLGVYARALGRLGYRCVTAKSGVEALERACSEPVDVVITDLAMPGMAGLEFMRRVRERDPDLPIIVVTGAPAIENAIGSIDAGVFRYLTKPILPPEIVKAVADAIHACALARARRAAYMHLRGPGEVSRSGLMQALDSMWMAVQPLVVTRDARVFAYEALLRTNDAVLRDPLRLLAAAEKLQAMRVVSRCVRALAARIVPTLPEGTDLFINLHASDLLDEQLFSTGDPLAGLASRVVLELTERASLEEVPDARGRVMTLKSMGYRVALDDLGAGYAGLTTFAMLKPDFVKIDLSLVRDVDSDPTKQTLIRTIMGLARELGVEVIAEGVETQREATALVGLGCVRQQGYLYARPAAPFPRVSW